MKSKTRLMVIAVSLAMVFMFTSGCILAVRGSNVRTPKKVRGHLGCDTKVAVHKRGSCHKCVNKGPRWSFAPHNRVGFRCVRR
jgi:hypothetical protein